MASRGADNDGRTDEVEVPTLTREGAASLDSPSSDFNAVTEENPVVEEGAPVPPAPHHNEHTSVSFHNPFAKAEMSITRAARLNEERVRQAFAAAEAMEKTRTFAGPLPAAATPDDAPSIPILVDESEPEELEPQELEPVEIEPEELEPEDVSSMDRLTVTQAPATAPLPRFLLDGSSEDDVEEETRTRRGSQPDPLRLTGSAELPVTVSNVTMPLSPSDPVTELLGAPKSVTTSTLLRRSSIPPLAYEPPRPALLRERVPAFAEDPSPVERQLRDTGDYRGLLAHYRSKLVEVESPPARAALFHKIASVYEHALEEPSEAFGPLCEAFDAKPTDDIIVASLERVAKELGRMGELADHARKRLATAPHAARVALLGHLSYWLERVLERPHDAAPFIAELERIDKTHPIALRRAAQLAAAKGDSKQHRELLSRALERSSRRDERVQIHVALAGAYSGTPDALKHYEAAIKEEPTNIVALQGIERLGREQEKHSQVEWALERQIEVAITSSERVDALLKLAELHEAKYLRRDRAADMFERVVALEPSNPAALRGLERCYHALRDWPRLTRVLRARAENTYDRAHKVELLSTAAEVLESKLGDLASAVETHRDLLVVDPKHKRALADLARLYEKLGDWANVATYKARLAELAPTKRQASQLLVQLGDFLGAPGRDPMAARLQYERAVTVDSANAAAWEALQRVATSAGDDARVIACLEQRAKHVDGPRQRAGVYVELGSVQTRLGNPRAARSAFESAIKSDPGNEQAAAALIEEYASEERWKDASALCELLVNAAIRDHDTTALFTRLRLGTRIAAALGDADRAMTSALAALEARPDDPDAQADLVAVSSQCRDKPHVIARAKDWLERIATQPGVLPIDMALRLAALQREAGDLTAAAKTLETLMSIEPQHVEATKALSDVYLLDRDYPRACRLRVDLARNAPTDGARFSYLVEAGEIWARQANELETAASVFEEARAIKPLDHWLLHTLMRLYGELGNWDKLYDVLESIAQIQESPDRKAKSLFTIGQLVKEKIGDRERAAQYFEDALDHDSSRLDIFEELVRTLTEAKNWPTLERAYRRMIERAKDKNEPALKFALHHQLGLIYRDRLEDAPHAFEVLEEAARLRPDEPVVRKIITELLVLTDNLDNAVARIRDLIALDPHEPELYSELYELFLRQHAFDKAWCAVNVLSRLREPTPEQRRFHEDYAPMPLAEVPGQLVEQAWQTHVFHHDLDKTVSTLLSFMTPAVARMRQAQLRTDPSMLQPFTQAHSRLHDAVRLAFQNAAEILAMPVPELLAGDPKALVPFAPAVAPFGAILVSGPAVEMRVESLLYIVGKRLAEQRGELAARAFFPTVTDLTALLAAAVRVARSERATDAASAALDASLLAVLMPHERDGIRSIVMQAAMQGTTVDVKRWSQAADLSSMRAGLLVCGDVEPARKSILSEPQSPSDLPPREKIGELYKFATSDLYADLRNAIGVAVEG